MNEPLCKDCLNHDEDWFDKHGQIVKVPFCAANKPQYPSAHQCPMYESKEQSE